MFLNPQHEEKPPEPRAFEPQASGESVCNLQAYCLGFRVVWRLKFRV